MIHALLVLIAATTWPGPPAFDSWATGATLRVDVAHAGDAGSERFYLEGFRREGPWAGTRTRLADDLGLGIHRFDVIDAQSGERLFAQGTCSIFGEWQTTAESRTTARSFAESYRFPEPKRPVRLEWWRRGDDGRFQRAHAIALDPARPDVERAPPIARGTAFVLADHGDPAVKVDLLVLGDGYAAGEETRFAEDAGRLVAALFATEPFRARRADFNVRARVVAAPASGVTRPADGIHHDAPLGISYGAFGIDRYVLTFRNRAVREAAAADPYDALIILFNETRYGGGGIYNLWSTCAARSEASAYVFVHEFGHSFAGLGDEYYSSEVAYEDFHRQDVEPWEPNVTALLEPGALKWKELVREGTPVPTPWDQAGYDAIDLAYQARRRELARASAPDQDRDRVAGEAREQAGLHLATETWSGRVGAFEGAGYRAKGLYRPEASCIMFSAATPRFCAVCARAIERVIDHHAR